MIEDSLINQYRNPDQAHNGQIAESILNRFPEAREKIVWINIIKQSAKVIDYFNTN